MSSRPEDADTGIAQPSGRKPIGMTARTKTNRFQLPPLVAGEWRGEIVGSANVNFGQVVHPGSPRQSVEFTYVNTGCIAHHAEYSIQMARNRHDHGPHAHEDGIPRCGRLF